MKENLVKKFKLYPQLKPASETISNRIAALSGLIKTVEQGIERAKSDIEGMERHLTQLRVDKQSHEIALAQLQLNHGNPRGDAGGMRYGTT